MNPHGIDTLPRTRHIIGVLLQEANKARQQALLAAAQDRIDDALREFFAARNLYVEISGLSIGHFSTLLDICAEAVECCLTHAESVDTNGGLDATAFLRHAADFSRGHQQLSIDAAERIFNKSALRLFRLGMYQAAAEACEISAALVPTNASYHTHVGTFWSHVACADQIPARRAECLAKAQAAWREALQHDPGHVDASLALVENSLTGGDWREAASEAIRIWSTDLDPREKTVCAWLGAIASILADQADVECAQMMSHLFSEGPHGNTNWWQLTEIDTYFGTALQTLPPRVAQSVRQILDRFRVLRERG